MGVFLGMFHSIFIYFRYSRRTDRYMYIPWDFSFYFYIFLGILGGQMGIFLGASLLTLSELLEFVILSVVLFVKRCRCFMSTKKECLSLRIYKELPWFQSHEIHVFLQICHKCLSRLPTYMSQVSVTTYL
jgi:hypothetical protein